MDEVIKDVNKTQPICPYCEHNPLEFGLKFVTVGETKVQVTFCMDCSKVITLLSMSVPQDIAPRIVVPGMKVVQ